MVITITPPRFHYRSNTNDPNDNVDIYIEGTWKFDGSAKVLGNTWSSSDITPDEAQVKANDLSRGYARMASVARNYRPEDKRNGRPAFNSKYLVEEFTKAESVLRPHVPQTAVKKGEVESDVLQSGITSHRQSITVGERSYTIERINDVNGSSISRTTLKANDSILGDRVSINPAVGSSSNPHNIQVTLSIGGSGAQTIDGVRDLSEEVNRKAHEARQLQEAIDEFQEKVSKM